LIVRIERVAQIRPIATDVAHSVVCVSVFACVLDTPVSHVKGRNRLRCRLGANSYGPRNYVVDEMHIGVTWRMRTNHRSDAALCQITLTACYSINAPWCRYLSGFRTVNKWCSCTVLDGPVRVLNEVDKAVTSATAVDPSPALAPPPRRRQWRSDGVVEGAPECRGPRFPGKKVKIYPLQ